MGTPAGGFGYGYDGAGRLVSALNPLNETTSWSYLNTNWLAGQTDANGAYTQVSSNALGQATSVSNYSPSAQLLSQFSSLTHDGAGGLISATAAVAGSSNLGGATSYSYDSLGELLQEQSTRGGSYTNSFQYDADGNPGTFRGASVGYSSLDQCQLSGFTYDANGNPTQYNGTSVTFDANNQATAIGSALTAFSDVKGRRAYKGSAAAQTYYIYDGDQPIMEIGSNGATTALNTFGPTGLVSRNSAGSSVFYQFDQSGNTTERLDPSGNVLSAHGCDSFGRPLVSPTSSDPFDGFGAQLGYYTDHETGL